MADQKHEDDRWRELADLLGLPDDAAPASKPASALPPEAPAIKAYEEPRTLPVISPPLDEAPREEAEAATIPMPRDEPTPAWEAEFEDEEDDTPLDEALASEEPATAEGVPEQAAPEGEGDDDKPRRGRRRRRRGRRRGGDRPEGEAPERRPPAGDARPPRDDPSRDRQGRGRGNRRDHEEPRRSAPPRPERPQPPPEDADELPMEQPARTHVSPASDTDFSDWNVPSWQDLIAALYRPDR